MQKINKLVNTHFVYYVFLCVFVSIIFLLLPLFAYVMIFIVINLHAKQRYTCDRNRRVNQYILKIDRYFTFSISIHNILSVWQCKTNILIKKNNNSFILTLEKSFHWHLVMLNLGVTWDQKLVSNVILL